jgi:4-amino-4-deoxy-L-arabinose transferase-like glycosyltransferase
MGFINPLIGALSVLVFFLLAKRLYNGNIAIVSCVSLVLSPFFVFNSSSYFSHNLSSLFILLFAYFSILYDENERVIYILLAGWWIGFAFITRYYTALLCALPISLYIVSRKKSKVWVYMFYCTIGATPLIVFHMFYNYGITGNALLLVTPWANPNEMIGFVRGHTLLKGLWQACLHLLDFIEWTSPFMLFLYVGGLLFSVRNKNAFYFDLILLFLVFGYVFFYATGGNRYGPRYYYEAYPFVILSVVSNLDFALKEKVLRDFLVVIFCLGFFVGALAIPSIGVQEHEVIFERMDIYRQVKEANIDNAIIFVGDKTGVRRPMSRGDLRRNGISLKGSVLYAKDIGPRNVELKKYFPQKAFYLYSREEHRVDGAVSRVKFD